MYYIKYIIKINKIYNKNQSIRFCVSRESTLVLKREQKAQHNSQWIHFIHYNQTHENISPKAHGGGCKTLLQS